MNSEINNLLIIRLSSMGDILLTTPLLRLLKKSLPQLTIHYVVKKQFVDLLRTNPHIDHLHLFDSSRGWKELFRMQQELHQQNFDLVLDLHGNFRSFFIRHLLPHRHVSVFQKHRLKRFLLIKFHWNLYWYTESVLQRYIDTAQNLNISDDGLGLDFYIDPEVKKKMDQQLKSKKSSTKKMTVCLCPSAGFATKRWPVDYYIKVAQQLALEKKAQIILLGGVNDRATSKMIKEKINPCIDFTGMTTLMETACIMSHADVVVSNDTGLMHMANALKKKTVAVFGPTTRELGFFPLPELSRVIENDSLTCRPCSHTGSEHCPQKHFRCMLDVQPERVYQAIIELVGTDA